MELTATLGVAVFCYRAFRPVSRPAASLLIPAMLWALFLWALGLFHVSFAWFRGLQKTPMVSVCSSPDNDSE